MLNIKLLGDLGRIAVDNFQILNSNLSDDNALLASAMNSTPPLTTGMISDE